MYLCDECIDETYISIESEGHVCQNCGNEAYFKAIKANTLAGVMTGKILNWIGDNYGGQEMENPSYDIISLAQYLVKEVR